MLHIALKEWSIVCDLLAEGQLAILLRKGGIHEEGGPGVFRLEHPRFALFPSWAHQKPEMIKPQFRDRVRVMPEPAEITFRTVAHAARIWCVPCRRAFDQLEDLHCWTEPQLDMRFEYRPDRPLYLLAVRCCVLGSPRTVVNDWSYGGCKSWVPLKEGDAVDEVGGAPVLSDEQFNALLTRIDAAMIT
jgi:hypothetical protein